MNLHTIDNKQQKHMKKHDIFIPSPKCHGGTANQNLALRRVKNDMNRPTFLHIHLGIPCFTLNCSWQDFCICSRKFLPKRQLSRGDIYA